jgi:hypothetical protein
MATANNKKPAAPAKPAKLASVPKTTTATEAPDDDDLDTDGDEDSGEGKGKKLPMPKRLSVRINRMAERLAPYSTRLDAWPNVGDINMKELAATVANAMSGLRVVSVALASLPDDYAPRITKPGAGKGGTKGELAVGSKVRVTDKQKPDYAGVLADELLCGMTVIENRGNRVFVMLGEGAVGMFPRGHVTADADAS